MMKFKSAVPFTKQEKTPQELIGLESIHDGYAVHLSGSIIYILEVSPINIDLLNEEEQDRLAELLSQALNSQSQPFQIFSIGRAADLQQYHTQLNDAAVVADVRRRAILHKLMIEAKKITISADVMERHHYIILRSTASPNALQQISERAHILSNRLTTAGMLTRTCSRDEIISLLMLFADPSSDIPSTAMDAENMRFV